MSTDVLNELMRQAESLPPEDQLRLIAHLAEKVRAEIPESKPRKKWRDIRGALAPSALGEDAQEWVSRTRRESDEHRERVLRRSE